MAGPLDAPAHPPDPEVARRVRADQLRSHFQQAVHPVSMGLLFAGLMAVVQHSQVGGVLPWAWAASKWFIGLVRLHQVRRFAAAPAADTLHWNRRFMLWLLLDAATWGAMGVLFMPGPSAQIDALVMASLAGIAAIGVFTLFGRRDSAVAFISLALLPASLYHLLLGTAGGLVAGLGLLYWLVLTLAAGRTEQLFTELARLRHENALLAERHRQALAVAEQSSAAKSRFLATVSHEIRTPLNGILGMAQLLQQDTLLPAQQRQLAVVADSARLLNTILDDVLDMARIESGRLPVQAVPFAPAALARDVTELLQPLARDKGLALALQVDAAVPARWLADAVRVRQVLHNLVGNALKFTRHGRVDLQLCPGPQGLRFVVADTGPGIPALALERVFQPFEQADGAPSRAVGGAGLGLAIARQLARAMGGDVCCTHSTAAGSTFVFDLGGQALVDPDPPHPPPAGPVPETPASALASEAAPAQATAPVAMPPRVLVVEDNPVNALVAVEALRRFGLEPLHLGSGEAALALLDQPGGRRPALVLMDCQMPGLDGFETTRRWRLCEAQRGLPRLPVVAVTANASADDRTHCLQAGMDDHLAKPFDLEQLQQVLQRHLGQALPPVPPLPPSPP